MIRLGKLEGTLLLSFLLVFCFALLFVFRSLDNNTLVSWKWVFGDKGFVAILLPLLAGIVLSFLASLSIPVEKYPFCLLLIAAGASVLPQWSGPELMLDSGRYFLQAKSLAEHGIAYFYHEWGREIPSWTDLPLVPFLYGLVLKYGHESRFAIQLFNTIIFTLTLLLTYKIGVVLWDREIGLYGGLFLTAMPYLLTQVPQMMVDIHAMFFHVLALYLFVTALRSTARPTFCLSVLTITAAAFVKYSLWPMMAVLPLTCLLLYLENRHSRILIRGVCILATSALMTIALVCIKLNVFTEQLRILLDYQRPALGLWGEGIVATFLFHWHPFIAILVLCAGWKAFQSRDKRFLVLLLYLLLIFALQIRRARYLIPLMPFIALMASYGLSTLREIQVRRYAAMLIFSSSLAFVLAVHIPFFQTTSMMNLKLAGEAIDRLESDLVEVAVLPQERSEGSTFAAIPLLDLFTSKKIVSRQQWPLTAPSHLPARSPLLFTWNMRKPSFYERNVQEEHILSLPLVIISSTPPGSDGYRYQRGVYPVADGRLYGLHSETFRYRTLVAIYD